jgi:hypothetical protein
MMEISAQDAPISAAVRHDLDYCIKLLTAAKPDCSDLLWRHYVVGLDYAELAEERNQNYDAIPAAKFRHSWELNGATRAALNSPLKGCELNAALVAKRLARTARLPPTHFL